MASFSRWLSTRPTVSSGYQSGLVGLFWTHGHGGVCIERRGSDTRTGGHIFRVTEDLSSLESRGYTASNSPASWTLLTFYFISARKAKMGRRVQQQSLALRNI